MNQKKHVARKKKLEKQIKLQKTKRWLDGYPNHELKTEILKSQSTTEKEQKNTQK